MTIALEDADANPEQVAYLNAHGTSTPLNEYAEAGAIPRARGAYATTIPISSTKSAIGHLLGAVAQRRALCLSPPGPH